MLLEAEKWVRVKIWGRKSSRRWLGVFQFNWESVWCAGKTIQIHGGHSLQDFKGVILQSMLRWVGAVTVAQLGVTRYNGRVAVATLVLQTKLGKRGVNEWHQFGKVLDWFPLTDNIFYHLIREKKMPQQPGNRMWHGHIVFQTQMHCCAFEP